ncbi:hypothetical protein ACFQ08_42070, partial [Streptosporangium algeriense]
MIELYVAPGGDDSAPGTQERPFATLARAELAARDLTGDVVVRLRAGAYTLTEPLEPTAAPGHGHVTYQAHGYGTAEQEEVVIGGGRTVTGWREQDGVWLADVGDLDT